MLDTLPVWVVGSEDEEGSLNGKVAGASLSDEPNTSPDSFKLLKDPEIWTRDSGASRNFKVSLMSEYKEAGSDNLIMVGNGTSLKSEAVGKLKVTMCNKFGVKTNTANPLLEMGDKEAIQPVQWR